MAVTTAVIIKIVVMIIWQWIWWWLWNFERIIIVENNDKKYDKDNDNNDNIDNDDDNYLNCSPHIFFLADPIMALRLSCKSVTVIKNHL